MSDNIYFLYLACFAGSLMLAIIGLMLHGFQAGRRRWMRLCWAGCGIAVLSVLAVDGLWRIGQSQPGLWGWVWGGISLAIGLGILVLLAVRSSSAFFAAITILNFLVCPWAFVCFSAAIEPDVGLPEFHMSGKILPRQHVIGIVALTDSGNEVTIYGVILPEDEDSELVNEQLTRHAEQFSRRLIETGPADDRTNCHGWVFTGGEYLISGRDVDQILKENRYHQVETPLVGDLIIYRDDRNGIVHSGVVRFADAQGVLIEGKWGRGPRYIHRPENQPYGMHSSYYRSIRAGHKLRIEPRSELHSIPPVRTPVPDGSAFTGFFNSRDLISVGKDPVGPQPDQAAQRNGSASVPPGAPKVSRTSQRGLALTSS